MFVQLLLRANCTIRTTSCMTCTIIEGHYSGMRGRGGNCRPLAGLSEFARVHLGRSLVIAGVPAILLLCLEGC